MSSRSDATVLVAIVVALLLGGELIAAQAPSASSGAALTAEPRTETTVVDSTIEELSMRTMLFDDGTVEREAVVRVRPVTDKGVAESGTVSLPYRRGLDTPTLKYVRVRRPDGRVIETPVESALEVPADVTREAPVYTDVYERRVNVRGLAVGDVLEYSHVVRERPLLPGHVFYEDELLPGIAVKRADIVLSVPEAMHVTVKTRGAQPAMTERDGRREYRWTIENQAQLPPEKLLAFVSERLRQPAQVQVTTFRSWQQFGETLRELWRDRATVTPAIRARAHELVEGRTTEAERLQSVFDFVSTKVRYVSVSLGIGSLRPHTADEVLANGFGDCKDKHVLLEALLAALDIKASPVLIRPGFTLDPEVPSLAQFNHVITRVATANGVVWLDGTLSPVVAGYLNAEARNRQAFHIPATGVASLVRTPVVAGRQNTWVSRAEGTLDDDFALVTTVDVSIAGDAEPLLREAFRSTPKASWAALGQRMSAGASQSTQSDFMPIAVDDVTVPFGMSYRLSKAAAVNAKGELSILMTPLPLPEIPTGDLATVPVTLSTGGIHRTTWQVRLPAGTEALVDGKPVFEKTESRDFASYHLRVTGGNGVLDIERVLRLTASEVPPDQISNYASFHATATAALPTITVREAWPWTSVTLAPVGAPAGKNPTATQLVSQVNGQSPAGAIEFLQKAVAVEPDHPSAWALMGAIQIESGMLEVGERNMRHQLEVAPSASAYKRIFASFHRARLYDKAIPLYREAISRYPEDRNFPALFAELLLDASRNREAAEVLAEETKRRPRSSRLQSKLGAAYARSGQVDLAIPALKRSVTLEPSPNIWSWGARELADVGRELDLALDWAQRAVQRTHTEMAALTMAQATTATNDAVARMARYMETLGRVLVARGEFARAKTFCEPAWTIATRPRSADCLAKAAEGLKDPAAAARYRAQAIVPRMDDYYEPIDRTPIPLTPEDAARTATTLQERRAMLTHTIPRTDGAEGQGRIALVVGADGVVLESRVITATPSLSGVTAGLIGMSLGPAMPEHGTARLMRQAQVQCTAGEATCTMVLRAP